MIMRSLVALKFALFVVVYLGSLWPTSAENVTNNTHGNNTLFSKRKNLTKVAYVSCEWSDIRPAYGRSAIIPSVISAFLVCVGAVLCAIGKF